ncbi:MAG: hypothetical protein IJD04_07580 [Desulfovibrionaceae bacterium]|nr:hypothetical protein [Desulfovibrionaceae bacterium]
MKYLMFIVFAMLTTGLSWLLMRPALNAAPEIDGGVKDLSSPAPKQISSKEITDINTGFFLYDKYTPSGQGRYYRFSVHRGEGGEFILTAPGVLNDAVVVDKITLEKVQAVVDRHGLVKLNGMDKVTQGLPGEYAPMYLYVDYASGETLGFNIDGNPDCEWGYELLSLFSQALAERGGMQLLPPEEAFEIERFSIEFNTGLISCAYGMLLDADKTLLIFRSEYDMAAQEMISEDYIKSAPAILTAVQDAIEKSGLAMLAAGMGTKYDINMPHTPDGFMDIAIDYKNGRQIYVQAEKDALPPEWEAVREQLRRHLDSVFN